MIKKFEDKLLKHKFLIFIFIFDASLLLISPGTGKESFSLTADYILEMLCVVPPIFMLMGLMDVWIPKSAMMKYLGKGSGFMGGLIAFALGSFSSGPLYAAFPIAGMFIKKGVSLFNVFIFLGAWSAVKIPMTLFEASQLGIKFTVVRFFSNLLGIIVLSLIIDKTTGADEEKELYENVSRLMDD